MLGAKHISNPGFKTNPHSYIYISFMIGLQTNIAFWNLCLCGGLGVIAIMQFQSIMVKKVKKTTTLYSLPGPAIGLAVLLGVLVQDLVIDLGVAGGSSSIIPRARRVGHPL